MPSLHDVADSLEHLFTGAPVAVQILDWIVIVIVALSWISLPTLWFSGSRWSRRMRHVRRDAQEREVQSYEDQFLWVFVVPALNEEVTIADSVARLQETSATHAMFLVVDDGSDDATPEILAGLRDDRLRVLTRVAPNARLGKAAALNDAWCYLRETVLPSSPYRDWGEDQVIVTIVDADGRLDPVAPHIVADSFIDPRIGGVQSLVRIYNRRSWLTWGQDVEFSTFGRVYQHGRSGWGSANMGGNGQFNRLSALTQLGQEERDERDFVGRQDGTGYGPWRDKLTEDQDLGLRLVQAGWDSAQENDTWVDQQGLNSLRKLYRQRTRWAQGNWQAFSLLPSVLVGRLRPIAKIDSVYYLLNPLLQLITGIGFLASVVLLVIDLFVGRPITFGAWWLVVVFFGLSFGPGIWALCIRYRGWTAPLMAVIMVIPYSIYAWMVFPVLLSGLLRQALGRNTWAKTQRESLNPIDAEPEDAPQTADRQN